MGNKPSTTESTVVIEQPNKSYEYVEPTRKPVRIKEPPQEVTCKQMEMEFDKIYERSKEILGSLNKNPCHELTARIAECLENNTMQMGKCFAVMDDYRTCVKESTSEKLVQYSYKDNDNENKLQELKQTKDNHKEKIKDILRKNKIEENIGDQAKNDDEEVISSMF